MNPANYNFQMWNVHVGFGSAIYSLIYIYLHSPEIFNIFNIEPWQKAECFLPFSRGYCISIQLQQSLLTSDPFCWDI